MPLKEYKLDTAVIGRSGKVSLYAFEEAKFDCEYSFSMFEGVAAKVDIYVDGENVAYTGTHPKESNDISFGSASVSFMPELKFKVRKGQKISVRIESAQNPFVRYRFEVVKTTKLFENVSTRLDQNVPYTLEHYKGCNLELSFKSDTEFLLNIHCGGEILNQLVTSGVFSWASNDVTVIRCTGTSPKVEIRKI